jgi:hypothetical protein
MTSVVHYMLCGAASLGLKDSLYCEIAHIWERHCLRRAQTPPDPFDGPGGGGQARKAPQTLANASCRDADETRCWNEGVMKTRISGKEAARVAWGARTGKIVAPAQQ